MTLGSCVHSVVGCGATRPKQVCFQTRDKNNPTSKWPFDKDGIPKPAVVAISGDLIEKMNHLNQIEV